MDWIERWFNVSPDGGDGSLEWLVVGALVLAAVSLLVVAVPPLRAAVRNAVSTVEGLLVDLVRRRGH